MNNAAHPMEIWNEYGIASYNAAQSGQIMPVSYWACKELIEMFHPKVIVLDCYMLYYGEKQGNDSYTHQTLDSLSFSNRFQAALDLYSGEKTIEYIFPMWLYHTRWKELTERDFVFDLSNYTLTRGAAINTGIADEISGMIMTIDQPEHIVEPPDITIEYLEKIVSLCKNNNTELLLVTIPYFTSYPSKTLDMTSHQGFFNWVEEFAERHHIRYINYFHIADEIGFDWNQHLYNYTHLNYWGGHVITKHLGSFLHTHYNLPDHREEEQYANWNADYKRYVNWIEKKTKTD